MAQFCNEYKVTDSQKYTLSIDEAKIALQDETLPKICEVVAQTCHGYVDHEAYFDTKESLPIPLKVFEYIKDVLKEELGKAVEIVGAYRDIRKTKKGWKVSVRAWLPEYVGDVKSWQAFVKRLNEKYDMQDVYGEKRELFDEGIYQVNRKLNCIGKYKSDSTDDHGFVLKPFEPGLPLSKYLVNFVRGDETEMLPVIGGKVSKKRKEMQEMEERNGEHKFPILSEKFKSMIGKACTDMIWRHHSLKKSHKMVPNTNWCLICQREHSDQKFCVFVNPTDVIKSCFSGGSEIMNSKDSKKIIKQFNKLILNVQQNEEETAFMELQNDLWEEGALEHLMREKGTGNIFEQMKLEDGTRLTYAYVPKEDCDAFVQRVLVDHPRYKSSVNNLKNLKELISTFDDRNFPFLKVDKELYGFRNGVLNLKTLQFTKGSEYTGSCICRKYIDAELNIDAPHPAFDKILDYQMDAETKEFVMMSIGRTFFRTNELDKWQYMLYLYGEAGTGKSRIIDLLRFLHVKAETISRGYQTSFGLHKLANADIWVIDDVPRNMANVFPQESFQSCVSGGLMEIGQKHKDPYSAPFTTPMVFAGNFFMDFFDKGQISRRLAIAGFPNVVPKAEQTPGLTEALEKEAPQILYKCVKLYHDYVAKYSGQMMATFAPESILNVTKEGRSSNDPLFRFLSDENNVTFEEGAETPLIEVKKAFEAWLGKPVRNKLEHGTFMQVNDQWRVIRNVICKLCKGHFSTSPKCCPSSSRQSRSQSAEIVQRCRVL